MGMEVLSPRRWSRQRGVSLVETLVALLILSFVALSILAMFSHGVELNASGADYTTLTNLAKDKLEELVGLPFVRDPANPTDANDPLSVGTHTQARDDLGMSLTWVIQEYAIQQGAETWQAAFAAGPITPQPNDQRNALKLITVTVASQKNNLLGRRNVTVQGIRTR